jgi:hypothetical protein
MLVGHACGEQVLLAGRGCCFDFSRP